MWSFLFYVSSFYFQQWNSKWDTTFFNSSLNSKLGFANVALVGLFHFFQFMKEIGYWDIWILALGCASKFLTISLKVGKLEVLNCAYFHILSDFEESLSWYVWRRGEANLWLICQFWKNKCSCLCNKFLSV